MTDYEILLMLDPEVPDERVVPVHVADRLRDPVLGLLGPMLRRAIFAMVRTDHSPGGGSIQKVQWDNGPAAANEVTPYFDRPIVWG